MKLKDFGRILGELKLVLVLIPVVAMLTSAIINLFVLTPIYSSSTTLIVLIDELAPNQINLSTISLNVRLAKTYGELAKSRAIAEEVIENHNLPLTPAQLSSKIHVELTGDTEVLRISARDANAAAAAIIANGVAQALSGKVYKELSVKNIQVLDPAVPSAVPISPNVMLNVILAGIIGMIMTVTIIFMREYLDDTIRHPEEIEEQFKLPVLGLIPTATTTSSGGGKPSGE
ncbi:MAG: Wzz/FepE/Etk N-terminal domain-containing protein [Firmicutes bacterium]|nr:Wzz/FepE/Etk N-terminal domain-containing protein [Bacillota bacterium]